MRKVLSAFLVASVLLLCAAPFSLAASAPFQFSTTQLQPTNDPSKLFYVMAHDDSDGVLVVLESEAIQYLNSGGMVFNTNTRPSFYGVFTRSGSYQFNLSYYDLKNGYLLSTETKTRSISSYEDFFWYPNTIFNLTDYITFPVYIYPLYSAQFPSAYPPAPAYYTVVDPFVTWNSSGSGGGEGGDDPGPVDPTSVIRSLIPRPYGSGCTMYIADHLYLYSIFVGVPQQFEFNGHLSTSDQNHFYGDNFNVFDVVFTSSGSSLSFTITNRAKFSYNVIITKYDVVDGSFVNSQAHSVTAATDSSTPGVSQFSISLSDPSTYGIYQSGFFARSHTVNFPELRISWSDTIDYSLDFFVIRQGLVTIVQGINTTNSSLATANSTLSSISSTSQQILGQIQSFYTLVSDYFTWFKTTFYDNINAKWTFTNNYLVSIYNLLNETDETMTIEDDTSGVAAMESAKNDLVVTNGAGQAVDAGDAAAAGLSEAAQQIGEIAQPVGTINQLMQTIVFDKPKLLLPVIVALGLGLMVTILGKNKSD